MRQALRSLILLVVVLDAVACRPDRCRSEAPAFELEIVAAGAPFASTAELLIEVAVAGKTTSSKLDPGPLIANGRGRALVLVGDVGRDGFEARIQVRLVGPGGKVLARAERTFAGSGDSCNFFSVSLGATPADAGLEGTGDLFNPCEAGAGWCAGACVDLQSSLQHCGACGNACLGGEPCVRGRCELTLGGSGAVSLSGLHDYGSRRVVIAGVVNVVPFDGKVDPSPKSCDAAETGCLRIKAGQIELRAAGSINATGAGGGGGGGGGGASGWHGGLATGCSGSTPGAAGGGTRGGQPGVAGLHAESWVIGGKGGQGGGPWGGAGGGEVKAAGEEGTRHGQVGVAGGYGAAGANGDTSEDPAVWMGSGGGGGSGGASAWGAGYNSVGGSGGGGAGNAGGGAILLEADESITLEGELGADGLAAQTGDGKTGKDGAEGKAANAKCDISGSGGDGGAASSQPGTSAGGKGVAGYWGGTGLDECLGGGRDCTTAVGIVGGNGGGGAAGSGGGILLRAPSVKLSGKIRTLGGGGLKANGGTVKIFFRGSKPSETSIEAHHTLLRTY